MIFILRETRTTEYSTWMGMLVRSGKTYYIYYSEVMGWILFAYIEITIYNEANEERALHCTVVDTDYCCNTGPGEQL